MFFCYKQVIEQESLTWDWNLNSFRSEVIQKPRSHNNLSSSGITHELYLWYTQNRKWRLSRILLKMTANTCLESKMPKLAERQFERYSERKHQLIYNLIITWIDHNWLPQIPLTIDWNPGIIDVYPAFSRIMYPSLYGDGGKRWKSKWKSISFIINNNSVLEYESLTVCKICFYKSKHLLNRYNRYIC